jgi:hypothetical protein
MLRISDLRCMVRLTAVALAFYSGGGVVAAHFDIERTFLEALGTLRRDDDEFAALSERVKYAVAAGAGESA